MRIEGTITPGMNIFRSAGEERNGLQPVWCLDFTKPPSFTGNVSEAAKNFAITLPRWIVHIARIVHPDKIGEPTAGAPKGVFKVTNFDYDFPPPPLLTSTGRQAVIDGFNCRENFIRSVRVK